MAINLPSDIVLGVANAADPQKLRAAAALLARAGVGTAAESAGLTEADVAALGLTVRSPASKAQPVFDPQALASPTQAAKLQPGTAGKRTPDAYTKFEAFLIQTFVESMLPSDAPNVFGSGMAGKIWKSMLAEHLANEMAKSTAFGIADKIAKHREGHAKGDATGVTATSRDAAASGAKNGHVAALQSILTAPLPPAAALPIQPDLG